MSDLTESTDVGNLAEQPSSADASDQQSDWPKWLAQGPDEYKRHEAFKGFNTIGAMQKRYLEVSEELEGAKKNAERSVALPTAESPDEEKIAFFRAIGKPAKSEEYELPKVELPDGLEMDKEFEPMFRQAVYNLNLSKGQAAGLWKMYNEFVGKVYSTSRTQSDKEIRKMGESLRDEWPGTQYDENVTLSIRAIKTYGGEDLWKAITDAELEKHPAMLKAWAAIGRMTAEDKLVPGETQSMEAPEGELDKIYPSMKGMGRQ
jgi:hypothetical protein